MVSPCGFILICVMNVAFVSFHVEFASAGHVAADMIDSTRMFSIVSIVSKVPVCRGKPVQ